jgi:hypothetical protein
MDNFDLKQFLVKNKLTENSRLGEIKTTPGNTGTTRFVDLKVGDIITPKMWDKQKFKGNYMPSPTDYNITIQDSYVIKDMEFDHEGSEEEGFDDWFVDLRSTTTGKPYNTDPVSFPYKTLETQFHLNSLLKDGYKIVSPDTLEEIKAVPKNTGMKIDLLSFIKQNQYEIAKKMGAVRLEDIEMDTLNNPSAIARVNIDLEDEEDEVEGGGEYMYGVSFSYPEDVDDNFRGENGDEPEEITVAGKKIMYINYNI